MEDIYGGAKEVEIRSSKLPGVERQYARYLARLAEEHPRVLPVLAGALDGAYVTGNDLLRPCDFLDPFFRKLPAPPRWVENPKDHLDWDALDRYEKFQGDRRQELVDAVDRAKHRD